MNNTATDYKKLHRTIHRIWYGKRHSCKLCK